jgi:hypothetical protein
MLAQRTPIHGGAVSGVTDSVATATFVPLLIAGVLGLLFLLARAISKLGGASRRQTVPWLCGYAQEAECHRYVAHNFYGEVKRYFRWLGGGAAKRSASGAVREDVSAQLSGVKGP